jgi:hypothetical protein
VTENGILRKEHKPGFYIVEETLFNESEIKKSETYIVLRLNAIN